MDYIKSLGKFTKSSLVCAIILLTYGYLVALINLYFFWESKSIGFSVLLIGLISLLIEDMRLRKVKNKKTILNKIGIGFASFIVFILLTISILIISSKPYRIAKEYARNNIELVNELGKINGFGLIPTGGISVSQDSSGEQGSAAISLIVKGQKKYKEVTFFVNKKIDSDWKVEKIEF